MGFVIFWTSFQSSWVVILGHIPSSRVCLHHYLSHPLVVGHLIRSFIILSVQLEFGTAPISIDHFPISLCSSWVGTVPTSIGHSFISLVYVFRAAPISIGHLLVNLSFRVGNAPISIGHSSCQSESGPHLYQSVMFLSPCHVSSVSGTAPISIGHYRVSLSRGRTYIDRPSPCHDSSVSGTAPISIGHYCVSLNRDCTYIDRSFILSVSVWVGVVPISIDHFPIISLSVWVFQGRTYIDRSLITTQKVLFHNL